MHHTSCTACCCCPPLHPPSACLHQHRGRQPRCQLRLGDDPVTVPVVPKRRLFLLLQSEERRRGEGAGGAAGSHSLTGSAERRGEDAFHLPLPHWKNGPGQPAEGVAEGQWSGREQRESHSRHVWPGHPPLFPPLPAAADVGMYCGNTCPASSTSCRPCCCEDPVASVGSAGSAVTETAPVDAHPDPASGAVAGSDHPDPAAGSVVGALLSKLCCRSCPTIAC